MSEITVWLQRWYDPMEGCDGEQIRCIVMINGVTKCSDTWELNPIELRRDEHLKDIATKIVEWVKATFFAQHQEVILRKLEDGFMQMHRERIMPKIPSYEPPIDWEADDLDPLVILRTGSKKQKQEIHDLLRRMEHPS